MSQPLDHNPLSHLFEHNAWATAQLIDFWESLSEPQLAATTAGAVGSVSETLHHYIQAEGGYLSRLAPDLQPRHWEPFLAAMRARADEMEVLWRVYAARNPDAAEIRRKEWPDVTP